MTFFFQKKIANITNVSHLFSEKKMLEIGKKWENIISKISPKKIRNNQHKNKNKNKKHDEN